MSDTTTYNTISIPDLSDTPYCTHVHILNNRSYYFEYFWNIRHGKAYLSIYIILNDEKVYLIRNQGLTCDLEISKNINNENWSGYLYFSGIDISQEYDYSQDNISTNYQLIYRA